MADLPVPANTTFEVDASDWSPVNGTIARSTAQAHSGVASLFCDVTSVEGGASVTTKQAASPSTSYTLSAWVFPVGGGTCRLGWNEHTSADGYITTVAHQFTGLLDSVWQRIEWTETTQSNCAKVEAFVTRGSSDANDFYFDDVNAAADVGGALRVVSSPLRW